MDVGRHQSTWKSRQSSIQCRLEQPRHRPIRCTAHPCKWLISYGFTSRYAVPIRINFWRMVGLYISFGDRANALECWRSPSLRLVLPGMAVLPGVTHSDSHHLWYDHWITTATNISWTIQCEISEVQGSVISSYLLEGFHPESRIPPRKTPKIQKKIKNASNLPPHMRFPQSTESRINTEFRVLFQWLKKWTVVTVTRCRWNSSPQSRRLNWRSWKSRIPNDWRRSNEYSRSHATIPQTVEINNIRKCWMFISEDIGKYTNVKWWEYLHISWWEYLNISIQYADKFEYQLAGILKYQLAAEICKCAEQRINFDIYTRTLFEKLLFVTSFIVGIEIEL